jgi:hypothetical protein
VGEELFGVIVGLSEQVVYATGLQVVLQELRGGKGHSTCTKQPEVKNKSLLCFYFSQ